MALKRYLESPVREDLPSKIVLLAGPGQVGKTTMARRILENSDAGVYLNWDNREDRLEIRAGRWPGGPALVVLDELHKWGKWKAWIKGEFDKHRGRLRFLVTGSARLDVYRRGSDSLLGRYHHYRLHPFSYHEATAKGEPSAPSPGEEIRIPSQASQETVDALLQFGGFPEPFLAQDHRTLRRWHRGRLDSFFREDVRDLELVRDLSLLELLASLLPGRVGSPLSLNSLREDLEASHRAVSHWMQIFERLYFVFRVPPFAASQVRSLHKMAKSYLWDWSMVVDEAARLENMVALHLLKLCHFLQDWERFDVELYYLRDRTGKEVDFLVTYRRSPWFAVEVKVSETRIAPALLYFRDRLRIPWTYQAVLKSDKDFLQEGVRCLPVRRFLAALI